MKRLMIVVCILLIFFAITSCQPQADETVMTKYHYDVNTGQIDTALSLVAKDATFKIDAAPMPGANGVYVGHEAIRGWLNSLADANTVTDVFDMEIAGGTITCLLSYQDAGMNALGVGELELEEVTVVRDGLIQSYKLSWLPSSEDRFNDLVAARYADLKLFDPADRKFYMPGHVTQPTLLVLGSRDLFDWKFFDDGYITNAAR